MRHSVPAQGVSFTRIAMAVPLILSGFMIALWTPGRADQEPAKPQVSQGKEEPAKKKQGSRKPKEEEEETTKSPRKQPLRVGDEDLEANQPVPGARTGATLPADLERETKRARHAAVRDLFSSLAKPHDVITINPGNRIWNVEPIPEYINPKEKMPAELTVQLFDSAWTHVREFKVKGSEIVRVEPYEQLALHKVDAFLTSGLDRGPDTKPAVPRAEMLQDAKKALSAVLVFHDSAVERGLRKGNAWNKLRARLVERLKDVRLDEVRVQTELENWEAALELGFELAEAYPTQKELQEKIVELLARSARESFKQENYDQALSRLHLLEDKFPNSRVLDAIRAALHNKAAEILKEAEKQEKAGNTQAALQSLQKAQRIYPQVPGLQDLDLRLNKRNPVLTVGVHDLPQYLSPATAYLDSEKQAVELLFESLVRFTSSAQTGPRYQPVLASELPKMVPLGRQFTLTRGAYWSDGTLVRATDVRQTVDLLSGWRGHSLGWAELLKGGARVEANSFQISLTLHQGYVDPLSLMDFKVLPGFLSRADDGDFAKAPIGSGPYQLGPQKEPGGVVFVANPHYGKRPDKRGLPRIREIHFVRSEKPVEDLQDGKLQLLLDLPTSRYKQLDSVANSDTLTLKTLPNRRIYFLAVNHRRSPLDNPDLRLAIAFAINREAILTKYFRAELASRPPHRALNGPYPPDSWAYNPSLRPADPYKPSLAKARASAFRDKEGRAVLRKLSLFYPKGDPAVEGACEEIRNQVQQLGAGIELELKPLEPRELRRHVDERDYDLAYYSWDYPDETYWLWPLFDPRPQATEPGGLNFLGYRDDEELQPAILKAMSYRDPARVKTLTHRIHDIFYRKMPFIPLWQLDTHLAIHKSLSLVDSQDRPVEPDPLLIFTNVETWKLEKR